MLDAMAAVKFNALYLHLTDDNCWPVEIMSYPLLTANCSAGCNLNGSSSTVSDPIA
jgi:N-acetyl-beta-hexosaminidase